MRFGYADPPYYQCAVKFYGDHPEAAVYDTIDGHRDLVKRLTAEFPDGWALCMGSVDLIRLVPHLIDPLPEDVRVAAWCKSFASFKTNVNPAYTWEPVLFAGGRKGDRSRLTVKDHLVEPIALQKGLTGAKPPAFNRWVLDLLGWVPDDDLVDLFPGTGGMGEAVAAARAQADLFSVGETPVPSAALFPEGVL
jgi:hypothetical protein